MFEMTFLKNQHEEYEALAQIAEMESNEKALLSEKAIKKSCMTWNERINQMTVDEKLATIFGLNSGCPFDQFEIDKPDNWCETRKCKDCKRDFLNSPYTEGENK